jgi:hypothetical protein
MIVRLDFNSGQHIDLFNIKKIKSIDMELL